jgi:hypothetical protein
LIKTDVKINFDFAKLSKNLDRILGADISRKTGDFAAFARSTIIEGKLRPLRPATIKARKSGAGGKPKTGSTTPLHHTGRLLSSIKPVKGSSPTKSGGIRLLEYGLKHNNGFIHNMTSKKIAPRPFLFTTGDNLPPKLKKRYKAMEKRLYKSLNDALSIYSR